MKVSGGRKKIKKESPKAGRKNEQKMGLSDFFFSSFFFFGYFLLFLLLLFFFLLQVLTPLGLPQMAKRVDVYSRDEIARDQQLLGFIAEADKREFDFHFFHFSHFLGNAAEEPGEVAVFINFSVSRWVPGIDTPVSALQSMVFPFFFVPRSQILFLFFKSATGTFLSCSFDSQKVFLSKIAASSGRLSSFVEKEMDQRDF